jgi:hypothetical protein
MQTVTWKDWCEIKKSRDREIEEESKKLTLKVCRCGNLYSYKEEYQLDPGKCGVCRYGDE